MTDKAVYISVCKKLKYNNNNNNSAIWNGIDNVLIK